MDKDKLEDIQAAIQANLDEMPSNEEIRRLCTGREESDYQYETGDVCDEVSRVFASLASSQQSGPPLAALVRAIVVVAMQNRLEAV